MYMFKSTEQTIPLDEMVTAISNILYFSLKKKLDTLKCVFLLYNSKIIFFFHS